MRDGARMKDRLSDSLGKTPKLIKIEYQFLSVSLYLFGSPKTVRRRWVDGTLLRVQSDRRLGAMRIFAGVVMDITLLGRYPCWLPPE
jgi:hypothetical protein